MLKTYSSLIILLLSSSAYCAEWGDVRSSAMGLTTEVKTPYEKITLSWQEKIIPGEDILMLSSENIELKDKYYYRYNFSGVYANSAKVIVTGSYKSKESSSSHKSESMSQTIYLERASDGTFHFIPQGIKGNGVIIIKRDDTDLGMYTIKITQAKN